MAACMHRDRRAVISMPVTIGALLLVAGAAADGWYPPIPGAAQYLPYFDDPPMISIEAENMSVTKGDWLAGDWGHAPTRFAATVANTFMSRRSCLHAPAGVGAESAATATFKISEAASYNVLLRYEQAYLFETPVSLEIALSSGGAAVFQRTYGMRHSLKVQAFGKARMKNATEPSLPGAMCGRGRIPTDGLQAECWWPYGATENWVWEGVGAMAHLKAGEYTVTLRGVSTSDDTTTPKDLIAFAERNIDAILLTTNSSDVKKRLWYASDALALDGYLSQAGEVFFKVTNLDSQNNLTLTVPRVYGHSYYFTMHTSLPIPTADGGLTAGCQFDGGPRCGSIFMNKSSTSDWVDVGMYMDVFNHGTWNFGPSSRAGDVDAGIYTIQVGVKTKADQTEPEPIGPLFVSSGEGVQIVFDASTRASRRVRSEASDVFELAAALDLQTPTMVPNQFGEKGIRLDTSDNGARMSWDMHMQVYGTFFKNTPSGGGFASTSCPKCGNEYTAVWNKMNMMFGIQLNGFWKDGVCPDGGQCEVDSRDTHAYLDLRDDLKNLPPAIARVQNTTSRDNIFVVSLGDEISVTATDPTATSAANFTAYCTSVKVSPADGCGSGNVTVTIDKASGDKLSNGKYYHSMKFVHHAAIQHFRNMTAEIQAGFPNAHIGANFAPTVYMSDPRDDQTYCHNYMGETFQWLNLFREGGATLPWSEDWVWSSPLGSQQMVTLMIDVMRSSVTKHASFNRSDPYVRSDVNKDYQPLPLPPVDAVSGSPPLMMYVMAHSPANAPASWRRQFYGDISHGVKIIDLFQLETSTSGYTCDYVDQDTGMYQQVRTTLNELTMFDDIVDSGSAQLNLAKVAILYSETADIWYSTLYTPGAAKRSLYLALRHAQLPLDIVNEDDCVDGVLNHYSLLFVVDPQVSEAAMGAISQWTSGGGRVVITAGGAQLNEYNMTNAATQRLLPVVQHGIWTGSRYSRHNATIFFVKQELPFAETLDQVTATAAEEDAVRGVPMGVFGEKSIYTYSGPKSGVMATFSDKTPAQVTVSKGKGQATYLGFHPGLAYMQPALPRRPVDRTPDLAGFTHFVPTEFN